MDQQTFIERIGERAGNETRLHGLFLAGSFGNGTADAFSDVDLVGLADKDDHAAIARAWRGHVESIAPVVFWNDRAFSRSRLINAITETWLRVDLHLLQAEDFTRRSRDSVKPIIDRRGIYAALPATRPPRTPDRERVTYLINEFIRVLGLTPVVIGRGEQVMMVTGIGLLRDLLIGLMKEETTMPDTGGALHLSKVLPAEDMAVLAALPYPGLERSALLAAQGALARVFFPRARALAARLDIAWPTAFEAATRRNLKAELGGEIDTDWT